MISIRDALANLQDALSLHDAGKDKYHHRTFQLLREPIVEEIERLEAEIRARSRLDYLQSELINLAKCKGSLTDDAYDSIEAGILAEMDEESDLIDTL